MDGKRQRQLTGSVSQILFEQDKKRSQQKRIGTYKTRFFHMCPGAQQIFPEIEEDIGGKDAGMLARMADQIFSIEEKVLSAGEPSEEATTSAKKIYSELMSSARKLGVDDKLDFMQGHIDIIEKGSKDDEDKKRPGMGMRAFAGDMDGALDDGAVDGGMGGGMMGESFITEGHKGKKKKKKKGEHYCASHTEHYKWGVGRCISESHAEPDRYGHVAWYDVEFNHGVERGVPVSEMKILMGESHHHMKEALDPVGKEDDDIDNDGKANSPRDKYLKNRRKAIGKAIDAKKGKKTIEERKAQILSGFLSEEDGDKEDMGKVVDELKGASKMHLGQAKRLSKYLKGDKKKVNEDMDRFYIQQPDKRYTSSVDKDDPTKIAYTSADTAGARRFSPSQAYAMVQGGKARGDARSMVKAEPDAQADFHQHLDDSGVLLAKDHKEHGIKQMELGYDDKIAYSFSSDKHPGISDPHTFHDVENEGVSAVGFMPKGGLNLDPQKVRAERMLTRHHEDVIDTHGIEDYDAKHRYGHKAESYTPKDLREATMNRIKRVSSGIGHNPNPAMDRFRGI